MELFSYEDPLGPNPWDGYVFTITAIWRQLANAVAYNNGYAVISVEIAVAIHQEYLRRFQAGSEEAIMNYQCCSELYY